MIQEKAKFVGLVMNVNKKIFFSTTMTTAALEPNNNVTQKEGTESANMKVMKNQKIVGADFDGMHRIALTTSGNLQRTVSAFYNADVLVEILRNEVPQQSDEGELNDTQEYVRNVTLKLLKADGEHVPFGIALSKVSISNDDYKRFFREKDPGLGQFFQHFHLYPSFKLLEYGYGYPSKYISDSQINCDWPWQKASTPNVNLLFSQMFKFAWNDRVFWRLYDLEVVGMKCTIMEILRSDLFRLHL